MRQSGWWRRAVPVLALAVGLAGIAGCSEDGDQQGGGSSSGPTKSLDDQFSVLGALQQLPTAGVDLDKATIAMADLDAATEIGGVERPEDGSREAFAAWVNPITGAEPNDVFVPLGMSFNFPVASPSEFADVAGWSVIDVASFAEIAAPPYQFAVVTGLEDDALADSLIDSGDGIRSSAEGEDFNHDLTNRSGVDQIGRPIRFLQQGDMVGFGTSTDLVKGWADNSATVADDDSFAEVAAALDGAEVVSAALTRVSGGGLADALGGQGASPDQIEALEEETEDLIPDAPFDVIGIGWDAEGQVHVAYHFEDIAAAQASADVLEKTWSEGTTVTRQPMSEMVTVEGVDTEGAVVVVTVTPAEQRAGFLYQMMERRELVFVSN